MLNSVTYGDRELEERAALLIAWHRRYISRPELRHKQRLTLPPFVIEREQELSAPVYGSEFIIRSIVTTVMYLDQVVFRMFLQQFIARNQGSLR